MSDIWVLSLENLTCMQSILAIMFSPYLQLLLVLFGIVLSMETIAFSQCIEKERQALLMLKQGLSDPSNRLYSWAAQEDCCQWGGIKCNNETGHVIVLNLSNPYQTYDYGNIIADFTRSFSGQISSSLLDLQNLRSLDLSFNNFTGNSIPEFMGSFPELRYLNLSNSFFGGRVPDQIGNLTNLRYLDLSTYYLKIYPGPSMLDFYNLNWISRLTSLRYLDMSGTNLYHVGDWLQQINHPGLVELHMKECGLDSSSSIAHANFSSLQILDLSRNSLSCSILDYIGNITSLLDLDLSGNQLQCLSPHAFKKMISLAHLDLSENQITDPIPDVFHNMTSLVHLDLSVNNLQSPIPEFFEKMLFLEHLDLSRNDFHGLFPDVFGKMASLTHLDLSYNDYTGHLPNFHMKFSSLKNLLIQQNQFNGTLPESISQLSNLVVLDVSSNILEGVLSEFHLSNLSKLEKLDISFNPLSVSSNWNPPSQLNEVRMRSCTLGLQFPPWLQMLKKLSYLDISNAKIVGTIPNWFWDVISYAKLVKLSGNYINGELPNLSTVFSTNIDLSSNHLEGPIPQISPNITSLNLSNNLLSGNISNFFCRMSGSVNSLRYLDLSENYLSGSIPDCCMNWRELNILNLAKNNFSGNIPSSIGYMKLWSLHLQHNYFSGELPMKLKNCRALATLDVGKNSLSGSIPPWLGESLPDLRFLRLRSNHFDGSIPSQLCQLTYLQLLDLAENNITGTIPRCFQSLRVMARTKDLAGGLVFAFPGGAYWEKMTVVWKGRETEYKNSLGLITTIDISSNNLSGEIPAELMNLVGLRGFNLSRNRFVGSIPYNIGQMEFLEFLDFSFNQLSGVIPQGLSNLTASYMDLSYNNLYGSIPLSTQLQSFDPSFFMGNPQLCDPPLPMSCTPGQMAPEQAAQADDETNVVWFYIGIGMGHIVGFWGVCGTLILNCSWRNAYFCFLDDVKNWVSVVLVVNPKWLRKLG